MKSHTKFTLCQRRRARHGSNSQRPDIYRNGVAKQFVTTQKRCLFSCLWTLGSLAQNVPVTSPDVSPTPGVQGIGLQPEAAGLKFVLQPRDDAHHVTDARVVT